MEQNKVSKNIESRRYHKHYEGSIWKRTDWGPAIFLSVTPPIAIALTVWYFMTEPFQWWTVGLFVFFYYATGLSITAGYHRLFAHKAYEAGFFTRLFFALFGAAAFQNSVIKWVVDHRPHHRYVDSDRDPYSSTKGLGYSHIWWMYLKAKRPKYEYWAKDLLKDPILYYQDKYYAWVAVFMGWVLPAVIGWAFGSWLGGLAIAGFLRMVVVHHLTFLINSAAHFTGRQTYSDSHTAKDNAVLAYFTYGEGYHNFHHEFANDYRNGIRWYDYDPTKWLIRCLQFFGGAKNLKMIPEDVIIAAKMKMDEKRAQQKLTSRTAKAQAEFKEQLNYLRQQFAQAQERFRLIKEEYDNLKLQAPSMGQMSQQMQENLQALKAEFKYARQEIKMVYKQWRRYCRNLQLVEASI